ncbi:MAG: DEAD/DEAH box helicase family protein [Desulfobacteraceae bacterium]|nr:DEAD/DEAH box helicase family protein [Desulfobacteraceae bacterium]
MERYQENIEAVQILKKLEVSGKPASKAQKSKLVKYNGWGGLSTVFESYPRQQWAIKAKEELLELLTTEEYETVRASVNNAHYTPPVTIKQIWKALKKMGFQGGAITDPALGIGNFVGLAPKDIIEKSNIVAIEKDPIAGRLAQQIYPNAKIYVQGYEDTTLPDNFFDLAITNVPFGNYSLYDPDYPALNKTVIHDYYFLKTLDKIKPDGILTFISSAYTMDKKDDSIRRQIHAKAQFLGAVRLPVNAQRDQAGTDVTTDIIFLQKRSKPLAAGQVSEAEWLSSQEIDLPTQGYYVSRKPRVNQYFQKHPEQIAGELFLDQGEGGRPRVSVSECTSDELNKKLNTIFNRMTNKIKIRSSRERPIKENPTLINGEKPSKESEILKVTQYPQVNFGTYLYKDGIVSQVVGKTDDGWIAKDCGIEGNSRQRMIGLIGIRDSLRDLLNLEQQTPADFPSLLQETELSNTRNALNAKYDDFISTFGYVNRPVNCRLFNDDPDIGRVLSVENYDSETNTATKADILRERVIFDRPVLTQVSSVHDGFLASLNQRGCVDIPYIADLASVSRKKVLNDLEASESIFFDPEQQTWITAPEYLSGDVRIKLKNAIAANELDQGDRYIRNIQALEKAQPEDLKPSEIFVRFGSPWIPPDVIKDFMAEKMQLIFSEIDKIKIEYRSLDGAWIIDAPSACSSGRLATIEYGSNRMSFFDIIDRSMNRKTVSVYDTIADKRQINHKQTLVAEQKLDKIQREFNQFLWQDHDRGEKLLRIYNNLFNNYVPPQYDGSHLTFPGMSNIMTPRQSQKDAIWRGLMTQTILLGHEVGVGKTLEQIALAVEMKRLGRANKPLICIPNHMLEQITREAQQLYPSARILMVTKKDFVKQNRKVFMGKIANNNWDLIVITHSMFKKINLNPKFEKKMLSDERSNFRSALQSVDKTANKRRYSIKKLEAAMAKFDSRIKELEEQIKSQKDPGLLIDEMGIDAFLIDEAHNFKNLALINPGSEVATGISGSQKARDLLQKIQWLYDKRGEESGVCFASGTPVSNNIFELYNIQRYLQPSLLKKAGLHHVNAWSAAFLSPKSQWEPNPSGTGWTLKTRYELINIPELMQMIRTTMDVVRADDIGIERPAVETINVTVPMSSAQANYMQSLALRVANIKSGLVNDNRVDNLLKIVSEGRQLSLDPQLISDRFKLASMDLDDFELDDADHKDKIDELVDLVIENYHETYNQKGVQLIFCDMGTPSGHKPYTVYDRIKQQLIETGIPEYEVAYIHDYKTDKAKAQAFKKVREGKIRVFLGSTQKMGEGANMQTRIAVIHDLDAPWRPNDIEQRGGRGQRFGNTFKVMKRIIYTTQDSFDLFMWTTLKVKAEMFTRIMTGDTSIRRLDMAVDPTYAETAAITTGNPLIREKLEIDQRVAELEALESAHRDVQYCNSRTKEKLRINIQTLQVELKHDKKIPKPTEDLFIWRMDLKTYGYDKDFKGERAALVKTIAKVFNKSQKKDTKLDQLTGITCGGIFVQVNRGFNKETKKHQSYWTILDKEGGLTNYEFKSGSKVEEFLNIHEDRMINATKILKVQKKELNCLENEKESKFEFAQELEDVKALQKEIEVKIQLMENPDKSNNQEMEETEESALSMA